MNPRCANHQRWLIIILSAYLVVGALYAVFTPTWQVPDEPAHYNYVRALAEGRGLPVIELGDYEQDLLGELTSRDFPPELSVESLEYEDHQPPLYYLLATPVYWLFEGAVLPLRLFSVLLGAGVLLVAFKIIRVIFPTRPRLALWTAAFIAVIPQHLAMMSGVQNDALAELVVGATLWALLIYVDYGDDVDRDSPRPWPIGLLLAAALLTKTTAYSLIGLAIITAIVRWRREKRALPWIAKQLAWTLAPAILITAPWFVRNGLTYGWTDPTGIARHNAIVEGQPRSSQWLALYGWGGLLFRLARTTFQSFWGQFGWMQVVLPGRFYRALALLSATLPVGFVWWIFDPRRERLTSRQRISLLLLAVWTAFVVLSFLGYNLLFVQHQGRYLYPALVPAGLVAALGLEQWAQLLPRRVRPAAIGAFFAGMLLFDLYCLFLMRPYL
ncbi:MAG TPA: DUF2142 domain-containing protein [Chloroflexi bacterium]|nr:DUF2142 domain-containing protein [Chloroflexota bacterium]